MKFTPTPQLVVFDMAGTTVQEHNLVYKSILKALMHFNISISLEKVLEIAAGKEKVKAIIDILEFKNIELDSHLIDAIYEYFKKTLESDYANNLIEPMHNILEVFTYLKEQDVFIALNTGYDTSLANLILKKLKWEKGVQYDLLITASDVINSRPHPDMILKAMKYFEISNPDYVVKTGDSITDIEEGKNAACGFTIGMTTGAHTLKQLLTADPDVILSNSLDIILYI